MPTPTFQPPQGQQNTAQLQDWIIKLVRDLNYILSCLDTVNINRLDAKVVIANTITADKMNVTQLSAIAADLGTITAGIIYGAYIATANGTYPRIEFSSSGNLLKAMQTATNYIAMSPNLFGPVIEVNNGTVQALIGTVLSTFFYIQSDQNIYFNATGVIALQSSAGSISDLVASINSLNSSISSLNSSVSSLNSNKADHGNTSIAGTHDHGIPDGTQLLDADGVTVHTFSQMGAHVHTI